MPEICQGDEKIVVPKCSLQTSRKLSFLCGPKSIQCAHRHKHFNFIYTFTATESHEVTQGEIKSFRVRLCSGFLADTQVSACGSSSNRCEKYLCMPHFRKCGFAETHSLNLRIREFSETAELLVAAMFPLSVNSTDKQ